jgi:hypothetical protein
MVKFKMTSDKGRSIYGLGITEKNIEMLQLGKPIHVHGEEIGLGNTEIVVFYGKDERAIADVLKEYITKDTVVNTVDKQ